MTTWRDALLEQARSNFDVAQALSAASNHPSQSTMLLQMAWEKLAKAALVAGGSWSPSNRTHRVISKFVSVLKRAPRGERVLGQSSRASFIERVDALHVDLVRLESLTPAVAGASENAEYPWEVPEPGGRSVQFPAKHLTHDFCGPGRLSVRLRKDFRTIEGQFHRLF